MSPIIIVGAPRCGTKMLRELLKLHPDVDGPLYEKERIWSYGKPERTRRSINTEDVDRGNIRYIRRHFVRSAIKADGKRLVDKSVINTLRIPYVRTVFPRSPIIHIVRDGRDAVCSIRERWRSPADIKYILRNRSVPIREIPFFVKRQCNWYLEKLLGGKKHVKWWGPEFDDMEELANRYSVTEICAIQWARCTEAALSSLEQLEPGSFVQVKYEEIVTSPIRIMEEICGQLDLPIDDHFRAKFCKYVRPSSIARWRDLLAPDELKLIMPHLQETLFKLNYL